MDNYAAIRQITFAALASAIGIDLKRFKRRQDEWQGYCPIHKSKANNNCFSYNGLTGAYHCFSCSAKGKGIIDLTMAIRGGSFKDATDFLTVVQPLPAKVTAPPPSASPEADSDVLRPLEKDSWRNYQVDCPWLTARVPDQAIRERYGVFCYNNPARRSAYSNRVMVPIRDLDGLLYGYVGRSVHHTGDTTNTQEPKYLFPPRLPKSRFLFGAYELRQHLSGLGTKSFFREIYLVESAFCCLKFASLNLPCVAAYGWSVSDEQVNILRSLTRGVVYLPDSNKYDDCHSQLAKLAQSLWVRAPRLPEGCTDPESLDRQQILDLTR